MRPLVVPAIDDLHIETPDGRLFVRRWTPDTAAGLPPLVLLHESLGCVALWRDFPSQLAQATGRVVVAYDRLGFGQSDPYPGRLHRDFVREEGQGGLAAVLATCAPGDFLLLGHSVGGGMALAAAAAHPARCQGVVTLAAQAFVEARTLAGIREAERRFSDPTQVERLSRYHGARARWVLDAWIDTWLDPAFAGWNLDAELARVHCPVLALHGRQDEYGSLQHPVRIVTQVPGPATLTCLTGGHVPHREQPDEVLAAIQAFLEAPGSIPQV